MSREGDGKKTVEERQVKGLLSRIGELVKDASLGKR